MLIDYRNTKELPANISNELKLLARYIIEHRAEYRAREGEDVDVNLEIVPYAQRKSRIGFKMRM